MINSLVWEKEKKKCGGCAKRKWCPRIVWVVFIKGKTNADRKLKIKKENNNIEKNTIKKKGGGGITKKYSTPKKFIPLS